MEGNTLSLIPPPAGFEFISVTITAPNSIRILYANEEEINTIREAFVSSWHKGIEEENNQLKNAHEFKLKGKPFTTSFSSTDEALKFRLANNILQNLYNLGCNLIISSNLTQTSHLTTWFFHREKTQHTNFACIGIHDTDHLQFVNFPSEYNQCFMSVIDKNWAQEFQKAKLVEGTMIVKLNGNPWLPSEPDKKAESKLLIKTLINELQMKKWSFYGCSNIKNVKTDTLFFKYDPEIAENNLQEIGFAISVGGKDCLRCIDAPTDATWCVKEAIHEFWPRGIKKEGLEARAIKLNLVGNPWFAAGTEAIDCRLLICKIFERLITIGWKVRMEMDVSMKKEHKSTFFFQQCPPCSLPVFCLSLNETDKIRFINAPQDVIDMLAAEIAKLWQFGILQQAQYGKCFEIMFQHKPWAFGSNGHDGAHACVMLCHLIKACAQIGWFVILSADICSKFTRGEFGSSYPQDVDSLWFMYYGQALTPPPTTS